MKPTPEQIEQIDNILTEEWSNGIGFVARAAERIYATLPEPGVIELGVWGDIGYRIVGTKIQRDMYCDGHWGPSNNEMVGEFADWVRSRLLEHYGLAPLPEPVDLPSAPLDNHLDDCRCSQCLNAEKAAREIDRQKPEPVEKLWLNTKAMCVSVLLRQCPTVAESRIESIAEEIATALCPYTPPAQPEQKGMAVEEAMDICIAHFLGNPVDNAQCRQAKGKEGR